MFFFFLGVEGFKRHGPRAAWGMGPEITVCEFTGLVMFNKEEV